MTLTATEATGHDFEKWGEDCSGTSTDCLLDMTANRNATATFKPETRRLKVTVKGEGTVTAKVNDVVSLTCTSDNTPCTKDYDYGTEVTLTASLSLTHVLEWSGCDEDEARTCDVTMDDDGTKEVVATYKLSSPSGCEVDNCGTKEVCNCLGTSCPRNYARHENCLAHGSKTCVGNSDGCGRDIRDRECEVAARTKLRNQAVDTCLYEHRDRYLGLLCKSSQRTCRPDITRVGCVFSLGPDPDPIPGPIAHQDEDEWSDYEHGIVPTFECGAKANTCDVEFEDETVTTDDHGVVDKEDTNDEWRWECHSDNGTVRQCSASKDGG